MIRDIPDPRERLEALVLLSDDFARQASETISDAAPELSQSGLTVVDLSGITGIPQSRLRALGCRDKQRRTGRPHLKPLDYVLDLEQLIGRTLRQSRMHPPARRE